VILLDFGSIYCSSCMVTVPNLIKLRKKYPEENLAVFNIYLDIYNPQRVIKFFRGFAKDMRLNLLIDDKLAISRDYGVDTLPTTIIIDRAGTIRRRIVGYTEPTSRRSSHHRETATEMPAAGRAGRSGRAVHGFVPSYEHPGQDPSSARRRRLADALKLNNADAPSRRGQRLSLPDAALAGDELIESRDRGRRRQAEPVGGPLPRDAWGGTSPRTCRVQVPPRRGEEALHEVPQARSASAGQVGDGAEQHLRRLPRPPLAARLHARADHGRRLPAVP
jgi:thiol-disulfide isomerase/thioredoxin